ncbi:MAG: T9SS type A sorting domain-containing protein [Ignavibacterium sp.]|nr:T9SS type A sorting domain-containing protein [Ignavibacterium sp.]
MKTITCIRLLFTLIFTTTSPILAQWVQTNGPYGGYVRSLAVSGTNLFAGTFGGGGVFLSTNNGTSWTAVNTGLTFNRVYSLAVSGTNLFAGTWGGGVFLSTNNGTSWTAVNTGLTNTYVSSLAVSDTNLFAGTEGGGVWRRPLSDMITSVQEIPGDVPHAFALMQNYPNPFNPSTRIPFSVRSSEFVSLKVYDMLGREVATLVNENLQPGTYEVQWDASHQASGLYFYQLKADGFVATRRMVLVK